MARESKLETDEILKKMDKLEIFLREKCSELDSEELVNLSTLLLGGYIASLSNKTDKEKGLDVIVNQIKYHSQRIEGLE